MMGQMQEDQAIKSRYVIFILFMVWLANVVNYVDRMALSILLPEIKSDLDLSDGQLGLLVGFAFSVFYALCGLPIARLADRSVRKNIIAVALLTWSVATASCGLARNFWQMFAARICVGVGEAGCIPPSQSLLCDYVRPERRAGALAVQSSGVYIGVMLSMALAGWLASQVGWRYTFAILGIPGALLSVIFFLFVREPVRGRFERDAGSRVSTPGLRATLVTLLTNRPYAFVLLFYTANGFVQYGLTQWWPSLYIRVYHLSAAEIGLPLGMAIGIGSSIGMLGGGGFANFIARKSAKLPLFAGAAFTLLAIPTALMTIFADRADISILMAGISCMFWTVSNGGVMAAMYNATPPEMRTTAGALPLLFAGVFGYSLGPLSVGVVSDLLAGDYGSNSLRFAMIAPIAGLPIIALALIGVGMTLPSKDRSTPSGNLGVAQ